MKSSDIFNWSLFLLLPLFAASQAASVESNFGFLDAAWSPASKVIYFSFIEVNKDWSNYDAKKWKIGKVSIETGKIETLTDQAFHVAASPNGKFITFVSGRNENPELYRMDVRSKKIVQLTQTPEKEGASCWSPDSKWIAYNSGGEENIQIFIINKNGKNRRRLTNEDYRAYTHEWSPDGKQICYYSETGDSKDQIHVMNADGKNDRNITQDTLLNFYPGWTKDGRLIYPNMKKNDTTRLWLVNADGSHKLELLTNANAFFARQSPNLIHW